MKYISNKNGRPEKELAQKKQYKVTVRMITEEYYSLKAKARQAGITNSEYLRMCISISQVKQRLSVEQLGYIRSLTGMANNLNQIARKANATGYIEVAGECNSLSSRIDSLLTSLENDR